MLFRSKRHPLGFDGLLAGLSAVPEIRCREVLPELHGIPGPLVLSRISPEPQRSGEDRACWWRLNIAIPSDEQDERAKHEYHSREGVCEPEPDVLQGKRVQRKPR